jgi:hypothetical protein
VSASYHPLTLLHRQLYPYRHFLRAVVIADATGPSLPPSEDRCRESHRRLILKSQFTKGPTQLCLDQLC